MHSKKGYFFVIDAIIGLFILSMGLVLIFSFFKYEPSEEQISYTSYDYMNFLSMQKLSEINHPYFGPGEQFGFCYYQYLYKSPAYPQNNI